jgi:hypothetical protein
MNQAGNGAKRMLLSQISLVSAGYCSNWCISIKFHWFSAGYEAKKCFFLVQILLVLAGNQATNAENSNFMGNQAGNQARMLLTQISWAFNLVLNWCFYFKFLWSVCWVGTTNAQNSNFFGTSVGYGATDAYQSTFITSAGFQATNAYNSNFFGQVLVLVQ